ncbi:MAG: hypothetical protein DRI33_04905 [Caldiserica bacterium]|nr:MAG: hypothetical protein DRI33_04905 [Caldisericota bacterium]
MEENEGKIYRITIRIPEKEHLLTEKLAKYLHEHELIKKPSINEVVRYSLMFLAYVIAKQVRSDVQGGDMSGE